MPARPYVATQATCTRGRSKRGEDDVQSTQRAAQALVARRCSRRHGLCQLRGKEDSLARGPALPVQRLQGPGFMAVEHCAPFSLLASTPSPLGAPAVLHVGGWEEGQ